jgi:glucose dehydrogenase
MLVLSLAGIHPGLAQTDWPIYGHDPSGLQFSPLKQIDTTNVSTVDVERGLLFLPVGTPPDFYGGTRKGSNLYGSSLVALDAFSTG